jgi:hypothetical protein
LLINLTKNILEQNIIDKTSQNCPALLVVISSTFVHETKIKVIMRPNLETLTRTRHGVKQLNMEVILGEFLLFWVSISQHLFG